MDVANQLIWIDGEDKSNSIAAISEDGAGYRIVFRGSPKNYLYRRERVRVLHRKKEIDPETVTVSVRGEPLLQVRRIEQFPQYYRMTLQRGTVIYPESDVELEENCLHCGEVQARFSYFRQLAEHLSLCGTDGFNILGHQYANIQTIGKHTALGSYLSAAHTIQKRALPACVLYPFGINQSQKQAVENALTSQISLIQGPPGTGKTQTILNILANAVQNGQTVAVVSNNNSATHNVVEKLQKQNLDFLTAFLGSRSNKEIFLDEQKQSYPNFWGWLLNPEEKAQVSQKVQALTEELSQKFRDKNRMAAIDQELLSMDPESRYFEEYYETCQTTDRPLLPMDSEKALHLWTEYEDTAQTGKHLGFFTKCRMLFQYGRRGFHLFGEAPEAVIPYLQKQYYVKKSAELHAERRELEETLKNFAFEEKSRELTEESMRLFRHTMAERYQKNGVRKKFSYAEFRNNSAEFNKEYPVILSTTYSVKTCLHPEYLYDYLIVDEASQVDLTTGILALSCAKNVVIVGDQKQLPNVITAEDQHQADALWNPSLGEDYCFTKHSLLSSAAAVWKEAPQVLLREHYRCHPRIIHFCNEKFYHGQLVVMTQDRGEENTLSLYRTVEGNHARNHQNQREIDVIRQEVLPRLREKGFADIGVITPYRNQVRALQEQLPPELEVDTVHKFQGREKDAVILTSVDNEIGEFVDDPHMLNVAVSRAVRSLTVVTSNNPQNDRTNYGDLARYIAYHNLEVVDSQVYSVFDLLYGAYAVRRREYLKKHKRISEYDSENLLYGLLEKRLAAPEFDCLGIAVHVSLSTLFKDLSGLSPEEQAFARNPLSHTDFLLFRKMDKAPVLAIEVDGVAYHAEGTKQAIRDHKKDHIFKTCGLPLLRLRTDGSGEQEKIEHALRMAMGIKEKDDP